jgi:hypothetical protein
MYSLEGVGRRRARSAGRSNVRMHVIRIYIPEFPAWAQRRARPDAGPIAVVAGGRIVALERAKALAALAPGDPAERVERLCPGAAVRLRDTELEVSCWEAFLRALHQVTPFIEADEPPFAAAARIDDGDLRAFAREWNVQAGAAPDRNMALLAALRSAPGAVLRVRAGRERAFLARFGVERLAELEFSEDTIEQLRLFGYRDLAAAAGLTERQLRAQFGEEGERLFGLLRPAEEGGVGLYTPPPSVSADHEFDSPVEAQPGVLEEVLLRLFEEAAGGLGSRRSQHLRMGMRFVGEADVRWTDRLLPSPTDRPETLLRLGRPRLLDLLSGASAGGRASEGGAGGVRPAARMPAHSIGEGDAGRKKADPAGDFGEGPPAVERMFVCLQSLRPPSTMQAGLFEERPAVTGAVRNVHRRYPGAIRRARLRPHAVFSEDTVEFEER